MPWGEQGERALGVTDDRRSAMRDAAATAFGLVAGVAVDALLGDPRRGHPVALYGGAVTALEQRVYAPTRGRGAAFTAMAVAGPVLAGAVAERLTRGRPWGRAAAVAAATWAVLGGTTLRREATRMADALDRNDLTAARARLSHLCARDPDGLGRPEITRATVESVAENTADAVVAPLFWGAVAGVPGLLGYRAVNTLDAMVGYRSPKYAQFGWAAARLDDLANWVPARVTAALTGVVAPVVGGDPVQTWEVWRRDGGAHPSPNAGQVEAAAAGALGVRLGGVNTYHGRTELRPALGRGPWPDVFDIRRANTLSAAVGIGAASLAVLHLLSAPLRARRRRRRVRLR
jgi:adenosylcobinamide-phosphate synthase